MVLPIMHNNNNNINIVLPIMQNNTNMVLPIMHNNTFFNIVLLIMHNNTQIMVLPIILFTNFIHCYTNLSLVEVPSYHLKVISREFHQTIKILN